MKQKPCCRHQVEAHGCIWERKLDCDAGQWHCPGRWHRWMGKGSRDGEGMNGGGGDMDGGGSPMREEVEER